MIDEGVLVVWEVHTRREKKIEVERFESVRGECVRVKVSVNNSVTSHRSSSRPKKDMCRSHSR